MKLFAVSLLGGTFLFLGVQAAYCAPTFSASATLTAPAGGSYAAVTMSGPPYHGITLTTTSTNQSVGTTGEAANAMLNVQYDLYLVDAKGDSPDDFYSNPVQCDANGTFSHLANNTGKLSDTSTYYVYHSPHYFTNHAVADIFNVNSTSQKSHADSPVTFSVHYP